MNFKVFVGCLVTPLSLSRKTIFEKGAWELPKTVCHELAPACTASLGCGKLRGSKNH